MDKKHTTLVISNEAWAAICEMAAIEGQSASQLCAYLLTEYCRVDEKFVYEVKHLRRLLNCSPHSVYIPLEFLPQLKYLKASQRRSLSDMLEQLIRAYTGLELGKRVLWIDHKKVMSLDMAAMETALEKKGDENSLAAEKNTLIQILLPSKTVEALGRFAAIDGETIEQRIRKVVTQHVKHLQISDDIKRWTESGDARITEVDPLPMNWLGVKFDDGLKGVFDVEAIIRSGGIFSQLSNFNILEQVEITQNGEILSWPNNIEIDARTIYLQIISQGSDGYDIEDTTMNNFSEEVDHQNVFDQISMADEAAIIFAAVQAEAKVKREGLSGIESKKVYLEVKEKVRWVITELGNPIPEGLSLSGDEDLSNRE